MCKARAQIAELWSLEITLSLNNQVQTQPMRTLHIYLTIQSFPEENIYGSNFHQNQNQLNPIKNLL